MPAQAERFRSLARVSWMAPLVAIAINLVLSAGAGGKIGPTTIVQMIVGPLLIVGGLCLGVIALFGIRRYGRKGILVPAVAGILVNLFLVVAALIPFLRLMNRSRLEPVVHIPAAQVLRDDRLRFSIDIPEGFRAYPEGKVASTIEHAYVKGVLGGGEALSVINIERLDGVIPKGKPLGPENLPRGFKGEVARRNWRGLAVDTLITTHEQAGLHIVVFTVQVPLRPMAIQLNVGGPASKREESERLVTQLLASLDGETNW